MSKLITKTKPKRPTSSIDAERITKEFQALAIKHGWDSAICYVIPGETKGDNKRVLGTCGGEAGSLKELLFYVNQKAYTKINQAEITQ